MTDGDGMKLVTAAILAVVAILLFANWHRKRLLDWAMKEVQWLNREADELQTAYKVIVQNREWKTTRHHPGNQLVTLQYDARARAFNARRKRLLEVTYKVQKLLPW